MQIRPDSLRLASVDQVAYSQKAASSAPATGRSQVQLSSGAQQMAQLHEQVENAPDVRADKVQQMKDRIASGSYKPDLDKMASFFAKALQ